MESTMRDVVIVGAVRSPVGKKNGSLAHKPATELLGDVMLALLDRVDVEPAAIDHVVGGCVQQIGVQSGNVTRNAWLAAGLPLEVPAVTVNTQCGSSQEALTLGHALVASGLVDTSMVCGIETMSAIPIGSAAPAEPDFGQPRGFRYADYWEPTTQFEGAELIAETWGLTRDELEVYAKSSQDRAAQAWEAGRYDSQVAAIEAPMIDDRGAVVGTKTFDRDEGMRPTTLEGLAALKPNLQGRDPSFHTAGTSSQISDGAGALLLMPPERADALGLRPLARVVDSVLVGSDPPLMLTGPMPATRALLERSHLSLDDIDIFEINEAFASVVVAWQRELGADPERVNVNGGAIALGHPLGATGSILATKAVAELERREARYALVSMCCGGGLGTGTLLERC
jgi:acetyl-CoA C-acetyltransferase